MRQANWWQRMGAWALVGVLMVGLWAMPGWARRSIEEKLKLIEVLQINYEERDLERLF